MSFGLQSASDFPKLLLSSEIESYCDLWLVLLDLVSVCSIPIFAMKYIQSSFSRISRRQSSPEFDIVQTITHFEQYLFEIKKLYARFFLWLLKGCTHHLDWQGERIIIKRECELDHLQACYGSKTSCNRVPTWVLVYKVPTIFPNSFWVRK